MDSYQPANGVTPEAFERITFSGVDPDTQPSLAYRLLGSLTKRGAQRNQVQHRARLPLAGLGKLIGAGLNKRFHEDDVKKGVPGDAQSAVENSRAFNYYHHRVMLPAITGVIQNIKREFADQFVLIKGMAQAVEHSLGALTIEFREHAADVIEWARCEAKAVVDLDQRITTGRAKQLHAMIDGAATLDDISAVIREWYQNRGLFAWFKELEPADAITILPMIFADYSSAQGLSGLLNAPYTRVRALLLLLYMSVIGPRRWGPQYAAAIDFVMTSAASGAFGTAAEIQTGEWKSTVVSATAAEPGHIMCEFKSRGAPLTATKRKIRLHTASAMTAVGEVPLSLDPTSFNMGLTMEAGGMTSGHQVTMPRLYFPKNYPLDVQKGTGVPFYIVLRFVGDEERSCVSEVVIPSTGAIFEVPLTAPVP